MKIEKLAEDKIKITITIADLQARNIDLYSFVYNSPESQSLFWDMMNKAEKEYGFNVDDSMIYVEASTSGSGNFTFIVTKTQEKPVIKINTTKQQTKDTIKLKRKKIPYFLKDGLYKFENFDDLCEFCKTSDPNTIVDTKLYSYQNTYYLKAGIIPATQILEYAEIQNSSNLLESKISEHGKTIIENDVINTINTHFNKKRKK